MHASSKAQAREWLQFRAPSTIALALAFLSAGLLTHLATTNINAAAPPCLKAPLDGSVQPAAVAAVPAGEPPRTCSPPTIEPTPWAAHCQHLRRVCVDQGALILYDERYQEVGQRPAAPLPRLEVDPSRLYTYPWRGAPSTGGEEEAVGWEQTDAGAGGGSTEATQGDGEGGRAAQARPAGGQGGDGAARPATEADSGGAQALGRAGGAEQRRLLLDEQPRPTAHLRRLAYKWQAPHKYRRRYEPLPMRPASSREPAPYLAAPSFSACTVPILVYPLFPDNFLHVFHDLASYLHALLRRTPWRAHAKLVVVTPEGLAMTPPEAQLLPPLTQLSVQTWADFSRRLPPEYDPPAQGWDGRQPRPSFEGGEQRCFQHLFVCGRRFTALRALEERLPEGQAAAQQVLMRGVPRENHAYGQLLVQHVEREQQQQQGQQQQRQGQQPTEAPEHSPQQQQGPVRGQGAGTRLRVVFMKREGEERQILNSAELVRRCNEWRYKPGGSKQEATAECWEAELPTLRAGVAAAQAADVFVGVHGANLANAWLMRPGSSVVELSPYEFGLRPGSFGLSHANAQDPSSQVLWWLAVVCDPAISQPGPAEVAGTGKAGWWPRDRSVRPPWAALEAVLGEVVSAGGDRQRYLDLYRNATHRFNVGAGGVLSRGVGPEGEHGGCPDPA